MKNLSLILRILAIVAAIAATTLFFISKGKLADKQAELTHTQDVLASTETELSDTKNTLQRTETQLKREQKDLAETEQELEEVRSDLYSSEQEVARLENDIRDADSEIASLKDTAQELRTDLVATQEELADASREAEINQLNQQIAELKDENLELTLDLEAKKAVADALTAKQEKVDALKEIDTSVGLLSPSGEPIKRIKIETTVDSISPSDGLIVLNSNPEMGLSQGQTLTLVQNLKSMGKVNIQRVEDSYAIANIMPGSAGANKLSSGSKVQLLF